MELKSDYTYAHYNPKQLLESTYDSVLLQNELSTARWTKFKDDHEILKSHLLMFRDKLKHDIMVPVGKLALLKGKLVHTNEILVSLGDGWFAKRSAAEAVDICNRRIKYCDEMLDKLTKERDLVTSRKTFPSSYDLFNGEIIEEYDENSEAAWKEKHRESVKSHKKEEAIKRQEIKVENEKDVLDLLDELEKQEDLEDEFNRLDLNSDEYESETEDEESSESDYIIEHDQPTSSSNSKGEYAEISKSEEILNPSKTFSSSSKVSFAEPTDDEFEPIHISFKHSNTAPKDDSSEPCKTNINSPSDIYKSVIRSTGVPKSILKKSTSAPVNILRDDDRTSEESPKDDIGKSASKPSSINVKIGEVMERSQVPITTTQSSRPVSKFKASRQATRKPS